MKRRVVGTLVGLAYAVICGFLSLLSTGGGHGSFMWLFLFVVPGLCGVYYLLMGYLAADLGNSEHRWIFGILLGVNLIVSLLIIWGSITDDPYTLKALELEPIVSIMLTAIHLVPSFALGIRLLSSILTDEQTDENSTLSIIS
jgi:hypothetical protein